MKVWSVTSSSTFTMSTVHTALLLLQHQSTAVAWTNCCKAMQACSRHTTRHAMAILQPYCYQCCYYYIVHLQRCHTHAHTDTCPKLYYNLQVRTLHMYLPMVQWISIHLIVASYYKPSDTSIVLQKWCKWCWRHRFRKWRFHYVTVITAQLLSCLQHCVDVCMQCV